MKVDRYRYPGNLQIPLKSFETLKVCYIGLLKDDLKSDEPSITCNACKSVDQHNTPSKSEVVD